MKNRHPERNKETGDLLKSKKTCPEETVYQIGTLDNHVPPELLIEMCIRDRDKKTKRADKEDWVVFDDTQEPIVDEETWLLAQKLRQNVRKADPCLLYTSYPYVWGGSNPDTSFDCSGFVSYVLTNSGLVNTGRLGAQGLYNISTPVSKANAQPGDLIFFVGTYDTPGVSHVGIYVGDGVMIHCGDPIQYTSINSSYRCV